MLTQHEQIQVRSGSFLHVVGRRVHDLSGDVLFREIFDIRQEKQLILVLIDFQSPKESSIEWNPSGVYLIHEKENGKCETETGTDEHALCVQSLDSGSFQAGIRLKFEFLHVDSLEYQRTDERKYQHRQWKCIGRENVSLFFGEELPKNRRNKLMSDVLQRHAFDLLKFEILIRVLIRIRNLFIIFDSAY